MLLDHTNFAQNLQGSCGGSGQHKKDVDLAERAQRRAIKIIREMEQLSCEDRLGKLGLLKLEKRRIQGDLTELFNT